jgi:hypothetical protein
VDDKKAQDLDGYQRPRTARRPAAGRPRSRTSHEATGDAYANSEQAPRRQSQNGATFAAAATPNDDDDRRTAKPSYRFNCEVPLALAHLRNEPRWVAWNYRWIEKARKWTKPPLDPRTGRNASVGNPQTWTTFDVAVAGMERHGLAGVGLVLIAGGGVSGIDLDHCITDSDCLTPLAAEVISCGETYAERSPSSEGIRMFLSDDIARALKDDGIGVEIYSSGRFLTVAGRHIEGTPTEIRPAPRTLARLTAAVNSEREKKRGGNGFKPNAKTNGKTNGWARAGSDFFSKVNAAALAKLDAWVRALHPTARYQHGTGAWRISPEDLGRPGLEEDLSYHPSGISDFGEEYDLTPIDAVKRYGDAVDAKAAGFWLCQRLGIEPACLGWQGAATLEDRAADVRADGAQEQSSSIRGTGIAAADIKSWPIMESKAMHGIVGRIARLATANSEADPVAVIATTLTWAAAEFGRCQFIFIGDEKHHSRHFCSIVGQSSRARKGTSKAPVKRIFEEADKIRRNASTLPFPSGSRLKVSNGPLSFANFAYFATSYGARFLMNLHSNSVVLAKLYEHLSRRGRRYFVGRIGAVKLLMVETGSVDRGSPVWQICLEQGTQTTEHEIALAREIAADDGAVAR